ncbi:MAG: hypothetical protein COV91_05095 [Candidatus Taylorbacteria bacterium CG11_big_fil_rev_8_21_14_0_20_46_11]|uniref:DNA replication/recombination mediator RecO N-terminal domain-containing protein n=1 Tax=Candidatus Taylorbacteria bacterium CG11_big_fil_rev_8_21_14_0_20_46_11 TaxID=1975025 RepID=A0A2H0KCD2_9BACT|nr:MAG: hypothetical protein COV91_05095 [Candidatus Taylorbacteria bacterium CG11_big_fil_rev_8_21_14_0_20_46_11]
MYHLYHTEAFIIGSTPRGEGSQTITLLTKELGLITTTAQSVREERSKLRYGLQEFSLSYCTLVRGKGIWRLTSAVLTEHLYHTFRGVPEASLLFGRVFRLLRRLAPGEEKNEHVFIAVRESIEFAKTYPILPVAEIEIVLVLRVLYLLGYLAPRGEFGAVLANELVWNESLLDEAKSFRTIALTDINNSLQATQL